MENRPFPWSRTFVLGLGFFGISIIWPIFNSLIPPMLDKLGLTSLVIGFIMTWDNLLNLFLQPYIGVRSDRTRSRWGRRKPYLLLGAPMAAIFFMVIPFVRDNFVLIGLGILLTDIGMALFRTPTVAYLGDLFTPRERSNANGVINLMGGVGGAVALFGGGALYRIGIPLPFIVGAAVMVLAIAAVLAFVKEPEAPPGHPSDQAGGVLHNLAAVAYGPDKNGILLLGAIFCWFIGWNAVEAFFTLYVSKVLAIPVGTGTQMLTAFAATLIIFSIPSGLIATRIGRKPTILIGLAGMLVGLILAFVLKNPTALLILLAVMGAFWALVNINSLPMVLDLGALRNTGGLTGLYYFASSGAAVGGPILAGGVIDLTGGDHSTIWLFSAIFLGLAIICMALLKPKPITMTAAGQGALSQV